MNTLITISSLVIGAMLASQNPNAQAPRGLTKVAPQAGGQARSQAPQLNTAQALDAWREQLTDPDLAKREQAFDHLAAAARHDRNLAKAVRDWSTDTQNLELAWTARLALRELKTQPFDMFDWPGLHVQGLDLQYPDFPDQLFKRFDPAIPLDQWGGNWPGFDPNQQGLNQQGSSSSSCESYSLQIGPDGVKCTVKSDIDGQEVTQEYQAESLDRLLEDHPELSDKLRVGNDPFSGFSFGGPGQGGLQRFNPFGWFDRQSPDGLQPQPQEAELPPLRTDVLGVVVQPLSEAEAKQLDLEPGVGLRIVERVYDGTIAHSMGLQRGQVLVEMNGRALKERDDITAEIKKRGSDGQVECVVIDRWGQRRTHTWKPDPGRQL